MIGEFNCIILNFWNTSVILGLIGRYPGTDLLSKSGVVEHAGPREDTGHSTYLR